MNVNGDESELYSDNAVALLLEPIDKRCCKEMYKKNIVWTLIWREMFYDNVILGVVEKYFIFLCFNAPFDNNLLNGFLRIVPQDNETCDLLAEKSDIKSV